VRPNLFRLAVLTVVAIGISALANGCASAKRDTAGFAQEQAVTVDASFDETWVAVKDTFLKQDYELYTRDKRGFFEAFSKTKRVLKAFAPRRVKYTVELTPIADDQTRVFISAVKQSYGVTLLTYPGWHERKTTGDVGVDAILAAVGETVARNGTVGEDV